MAGQNMMAMNGVVPVFAGHGPTTLSKITLSKQSALNCADCSIFNL
jgi:hypothetical protein